MYTWIINGATGVGKDFIFKDGDSAPSLPMLLSLNVTMTTKVPDFLLSYERKYRCHQEKEGVKEIIFTRKISNSISMGVNVLKSLVRTHDCPAHASFGKNEKEHILVKSN